MDSSELQKIAQHSRLMRESGITLLFASGILALFLFVPLFGHTAVAPTPITSAGPDAFAGISLQAKAAIVYDLVSKETLYANNAEAQLPLASLTKLLTVYAALAELSPSTPITISAGAAHLEAPHAFNEGQTFSL